MRRLVPFFALLALCLGALPAPAADRDEPVHFAGAITALSATSISLHDGSRDLTCSIDATSPAVTGVVVGDHVAVACTAGVLTAWVKLTAHPVTPHAGPGPTTTTPAPPHSIRGAVGTITALSATSLTVLTDSTSVTCTIGSASPSTTRYAVGSRVKIVCFDGVLRGIKGASDAAPAGGAEITVGTVTALSTASITVGGEHGTATCAIDTSSPSLTGVQVGTQLAIVCVDGNLRLIARVPNRH